MRKVMLRRLHPRFKMLVNRYLSETKQTRREMCGLIGMSEIRLSELLTGRRALSGHYLVPFFQAGVFSPRDIIDSRVVKKNEKDFWASVEA